MNLLIEFGYIREIVIEYDEIVTECKIFYHDLAIEIVMESPIIIENWFLLKGPF